MPEPEAQIDEEQLNKLNAFAGMVNIADSIDDQTLGKMGIRVHDDYTADLSSRSDWEKAYKAGLELALQMPEDRTVSGVKANSVKYPVIGTAAIHFAARTYPNIVNANDVVKVRVIGKDKDNEKATRGNRVSTHMSYQILEQMDDWEGDMDQLLTTLSITGSMFKKTYHDPIKGKNVSKTIRPDAFVVNYYAKSLESASQLTHVIELTPNEIYERIARGIFSEFEHGVAEGEKKQDEDNVDTPHTFLEQHRYWDLDDDGYQEPYIITVHEETKKVVRIVARYDIDNIERKENGDIVRIIPNHLFTRFLFMPSFDGSIYGMGFGLLLAPLNEVVNATINDLLDAGMWSNSSAGFIGSGINIAEGGSLKFKPREYKKVKFSGDDIRKHIVTLDLGEPSLVLFQLLGFMVDAAKELSSVTDVMRGEQPQGDVPATTTLAMIEQGLKVFSAIYRRIHRSLKAEYKKIRRLNELYLDDEEYNLVLDEEDDFIAKEEYADKFLDIIPISSTADVSDIQKIIKGKALMEMRNQGYNDQAIGRRYLEALQIPDVEEILEMPKQEPPWEQVREKAELELEQRKVVVTEQQLVLEKAAAIEKGIKMRAEAYRAMADAESKEEGIQMGIYKNETERIRDSLNAHQKLMETISGNEREGPTENRRADDRQPSVQAVQSRERGGPVESGEPYIVGEDGPELMVPSQDGQIVPNKKINDVNFDLVLGNIGKEYPQIGRHFKDIVVTRSEGLSGYGGGIEFFSDEDTNTPNPGKSTIEIYDKGLKGEWLESAIAGDVLHLLGMVSRTGKPVDPEFYELKSEFLRTLSKEQLNVDRKAYSESVKRGVENRSFKEWFEVSRADAYLRGYLFPDKMDDWRKSEVYSPEQIEILERMKSYLKQPIGAK